MVSEKMLHFELMHFSGDIWIKSAIQWRTIFAPFLQSLHSLVQTFTLHMKYKNNAQTCICISIIIK